MKATTFQKLSLVASLISGGISPTVLAEGPTDLEALAEKAQAAAESQIAVAPQAAKEQGVEGQVEQPKPAPVQKEGEIELRDKKVAPVDLEKRIEKLGLLGNLSPEIDAVAVLQNGDRIWEEFAESLLGPEFFEFLDEEGIDLASPDGPGHILGQIFSEEFMVVVGDDTANQFDKLLSLNQLSSQSQFAFFVESYLRQTDDVFSFEQENPFAGMFRAFAAQPDFLLNLVSSAQMPPIILGARISDDEARNELLQNLVAGANGVLALVGEGLPFLSSHEVEVAGISFSGLEVDGEELIRLLEEEEDLGAQLDEVLDPATSQDLLQTLAKKDLVLLAGASDEAVYLFFGNDSGQIPFVAEPEASLAAIDDFAFVDSYLAEDWLTVSWIAEELVETSVQQSVMEDFVKGLRLGLEGSENGHGLEKFEGLLTKVAQLEKKLLSSAQITSSTAVSYLSEDGLHFEGVGGYSDAVIDSSKPFEMSSGASDTFLTVQLVADAEIMRLNRDYLEAFFEVAYELAQLTKGIEPAPADWDTFFSVFGVFDTKLKPEAIKLWSGMTAIEEGLGQESIFEIDLAGSFPTVPGFPKAVIEEGVAPRISLMLPVTDRAQLAESWQEIDSSTARLLEIVSELAETNIPMQKPMSSTNDGLKTWFFPIPMQTDDFVPSVTLDDEVMVLSTSKERALALAKLGKEQGPEQSGMVVTMNFSPLQEFLSQWLTLIAENPEGILRDQEAIDSYLTNREQLENVVKGLSKFHSWNVHTRAEDGEMRTSYHLKTN